MHVSFCLFTELTLGLRATPFKMSSSGLSSGSSIKVQSTLFFLQTVFGGNAYNTVAPHILDSNAIGIH